MTEPVPILSKHFGAWGKDDVPLPRIRATVHQTLVLEMGLGVAHLLRTVLDDPAVEERAQTGYTVPHREAMAALVQALREEGEHAT